LKYRINRIVSASAPANIALVKYMGKNNSDQNLASNPSLSLTLSELKTEIEFSIVDGDEIIISTELPRQSQSKLIPSVLREREIARVKNHIHKTWQEMFKMKDFLNSQFGIEVLPWSGVEVKSANTFPSGSGIASSASSFAALTLGTFGVFSQNFENAFRDSPDLKMVLAKLSRVGSGSSCRSFVGPWTLWDGETVTQLSTAMPKVADLVLLVSSSPKEVSSSEAHQRVIHSPLWNGRPERARIRVNQLRRDLESFSSDKSEVISDLVWDEFWEMHSLFHTSKPQFSYFEPETIRILNWLNRVRKSDMGTAWVTMDAGANIHVVVPNDFSVVWKVRIQEAFPQLKILEDVEGVGATISFSE
jgi:diphosphomevalonate decarboxylase